MALLIGDHLTPAANQVPYWTGTEWALRDMDPTKIAVLTPSGAIIPAADGAEKTQIDGTNFSYFVLDFDKASAEEAYWEFAIPPDFDNTKNILVTFFWKAVAAVAGNVKWGVSVLGRANGEVWDAALGAEQTVTDDTEDVATEMSVSSVSAFASGWEGYDAAIVKVRRVAGDDTMDEDARLLMVVISYEED
ncbi:hypothetical protein ES703_12798 [subsurface metagenome]